MSTNKLFDIFKKTTKSTHTDESSISLSEPDPDPDNPGEPDYSKPVDISVTTVHLDVSYNQPFKSTENILDLGDLDTGPKQPILKVYPLTVFGQQKRSFNAGYYSHKWLEYSITHDAIFCFPCRVFGKTDIEPTFTTTGFRNWKKLSGSRGAKGRNLSKIDAHSKSNVHITCMVKWTEYLNTKKTGSICSQLSSQHQQCVESNRKYMKNIIEISLFLAQQGLAFRGHDESDASLNQGNFRELCNLFAKHLPDFAEKYQNSTNYSSHFIQDEIINICSNSIRNRIISEIGDGVFAIMCDEARCYKEEQMALCVRYVKGFDVFERFLGFIDCSSKQDAQSLSTHIFEYFNTCKLSSEAQIIAQSYDGANVMSGKLNGVQAKIQSKYPNAIYTHCMAHRINLIETRNFFNTFECIYVHFSHPSNNQKLIHVQKKLNLNVKTISRISDTRWNCRYKNCQSVIHCYEAIVNVLKDEIDDQADRNVNEAIGILSSIQNGSFVVLLIVMEQILSTINVLCNIFQEKTATLGKAAKIIHGVIQSFENMRTSEYFSKVWHTINEFSRKHNISLNIPSKTQMTKRKRIEPNHLLNYVVSCTTAASEITDTDLDILSTEDYFRTNIYFKVLDSIIVNLKKRFSSESLSLATAIDCFMQLDYENSQSFIDQYRDLPGYNIKVQNLKSEMMVAKTCLAKKKEIITLDMLKSVVTKEVFPNVYAMIQIALTLPISSATCERSFSAMRKIKTWIRTSMLQNRFTDLAILYIEKDLTKSLNHEEVLNTFSLKNRTIILK